MRSPARFPAVFAAVLCAAATAQPGPARAADKLPLRKTGVAVRSGVLVASVGLQDLLTPAARERLTSGFATRVLIRAHLRRDGDPEPIAIVFQRAEIVYDIWDEKFRVRVSRGAGTDRVVEVATADQAIAEATVLSQLPIADAGLLRPGERYYLAIRGDLNPLSPELLADVRQWLRQPSGAQRRAGSSGGGGGFGSFVTVFVNPQIDDSENQIRFVSQVFGAPPP